MALILGGCRFFCAAGLDQPYVAMLLENGRLIEQLTCNPSAEAAIEAGLQQTRCEHSSDPNPLVTVKVTP